MAANAVCPIQDDLPVFIRIQMAIAPVTLVAGGVGCLGRLRNGDGTFGMTLPAGGLLPLMAFKTSLFWRSKGRGDLRIVIDVVMAGNTGIVQRFNVKLVGYLDLPYVIFIEGWLISNQILMATSAIRVYPVNLRREADFRLPGV
jgi:hypothetical protein